MWKLRHLPRNPEAGGEEASGGGTPPPAPPAGSPPASSPPAGGTPPAPPPSGTPPAPPAGGDAGKDDTKGFWPEDWRTRFAGGDESELKQLGRYQSPDAVWKKARELEKRMSSGELKSTLPKNPTEAQVKEWRAANGIPESADKYDLGFKVSDDDKADLDKVLAAAHGSNQTAEQVKATVKAVQQITRDRDAARAEKDKELALSGEEDLRGEWGAEFRGNINRIHNLLDGSADSKLKDQLIGGRLADGTPIGSSPEAMRLLLQLALIQDPANTILPGSGGDPMKGIEAEKATIEKRMREDRPGYDKDEKMQARYRELIEAEQKLTKQS